MQFHNFSKTIRWREFDGSIHEVTVSENISNLTSHFDIQERAYEFARSCGWTPRKWWQYWRWGEAYACRQSRPDYITQSVDFLSLIVLFGGTVFLMYLLLFQP